MNFHERKEKRKLSFFKNIYKVKLRKCTACGGSGIYDSYKSPPCSACNGTGKERYKCDDKLK
jgi:DnaJ-class molecular chaperone